MSSRIQSAFGPLGQRIRPRTVAEARPRVQHVVVDGRFAGVLIAWRRDAGGWSGDVAYVVEERLVVERLPSSRLSPFG